MVIIPSSVLKHVRNCADSFTVDKRVRVPGCVDPNTKSWMNKKVQQLLRERDSVF